MKLVLFALLASLPAHAALMKDAKGKVRQLTPSGRYVSVSCDGDEVMRVVGPDVIHCKDNLNHWEHYYLITADGQMVKMESRHEGDWVENLVPAWK